MRDNYSKTKLDSRAVKAERNGESEATSGRIMSSPRKRHLDPFYCAALLRQRSFSSRHISDRATTTLGCNVVICSSRYHHHSGSFIGLQSAVEIPLRQILGWRRSYPATPLCPTIVIYTHCFHTPRHRQAARNRAGKSRGELFVQTFYHTRCAFRIFLPFT